jgi:hypothetical protein
MYESELFCQPLGERDSLPVCARTRSYSYAFPYCNTVPHPYFPSAHRGQRRYHVKKVPIVSKISRFHAAPLYLFQGVSSYFLPHTPGSFTYTQSFRFPTKAHTFHVPRPSHRSRCYVITLKLNRVSPSLLRNLVWFSANKHMKCK